MVAPTSQPWAGPPETPHDPSLSSVSRTRRMVGLGDVHDHRRPGSLQLGQLLTLERLVLWSTPPTRCPSTGIGRRRRRIRRLHKRIPSPTRKNNATNDFQRKIGISNSLPYSVKHSTQSCASSRSIEPSLQSLSEISPLSSRRMAPGEAL